MTKTAFLKPALVRERLAGFDVPTDVVERLKHAGIAGAISVVLFLVMFLYPLDMAVWTLQAKLNLEEPSGEFVYVGVEGGDRSPSEVEKRAIVAKALRELDEAGARRIYVDFTFEQRIDPEIDSDLKNAFAELGDRAIVVDQVDPAGNIISTSAPYFLPENRRVYTQEYLDFLGLKWSDKHNISTQGKRKKSFSSSLASTEKEGIGEFPINYSIDIKKFSYRTTRELDETQLSNLEGKTIIVGPAISNYHSKSTIIPKEDRFPNAFSSIFAAETLIKGDYYHFKSEWFLLIALSLLSITIFYCREANSRRTSYYAILISIPVLASIATFLNCRVSPSLALAFLSLYFFLRSRALWKRRLALIDFETGLPRLRALEAELDSADASSGHIVIARMHGYEQVLKSLSRNLHSEYVLKLVERLKASNSELTVYADSHLLGWHTPEDYFTDIKDHLEGLRAIFAAPISVGGRFLDVGITFGVAAYASDGRNALAAAVAAAEETSEAHRPIVLAQNRLDQDDLWDLSLRAKIDEAMAAGEIFCVYQPKFEVSSRQISGVEALVRWHDPERGYISPVHFIAQCEKAGRMEYLTRYVLQSACNAGQLLHFRDMQCTMSVNVSATLMKDLKIVETVKNVLDATGFDPSYLILEVTETARIGDLSAAGLILNELKHMGIQISIDDFGVGAANFENLLELPFDELKIDRMFVAAMTENNKAKAIVQSLVAMGRAAGLRIVAEGAEDDATIRSLSEIGCTHIQGFGFARPLPLKELLENNAIQRPAALGT